LSVMLELLLTPFDADLSNYDMQNVAYTYG
jgi:hypothetical protein